MPEADDEFAKKLGPFESIKQVRKDIEAELTQQKTQEAMNVIKDELVGDLVKKSTIVVPDVLLQDQITNLKEDFTRNLTYRGMTMQEYLEQKDMTEEEFVEGELTEQATKRVQAGLALAEVAEAEDIRITAEELDIRLQLLAGQNPSQADQFDNPQTRQDVGSRMLTEKTVDLLVKLATKK